MNKLYLIASVMILSGCGNAIPGPAGPAGPKGDSAITPSLSTLEKQIQDLVTDENDYRLSLGQTMLSEGLSCSLSTITSGDRIQASIPGHDTLADITKVASFLHEDVFNQPNAPSSDGLNVIPEAIRPLYTNLFLLVCSGYIVATESGYHSFELSSDDASLLYVGGSLVIDNDNAHGITVKTGMKYLRKGVHSFSLKFAQTGAGSQALILNMNGVLSPSNRFYH